jgi:hypothetical protein
LTSIYTLNFFNMYINSLESKCLNQTFIQMTMKAKGIGFDNSNGNKLWHKKSKFY